jgi:hypothetical protein
MERCNHMRVVSVIIDSDYVTCSQINTTVDEFVSRTCIEIFVQNLKVPLRNAICLPPVVYLLSSNGNINITRPSCRWFSLHKFTKLSLLHVSHTGFGTHPASYPIDTGGSFPGSKEAGAWSWPLNLQLMSKSRKCGSIHPLPHTPSWRSS